MTAPTSVRILQVGDDLEGGSVLPGFRLALAELFLQGTEDSSALDRPFEILVQAVRRRDRS